MRTVNEGLFWWVCGLTLTGLLVVPGLRWAESRSHDIRVEQGRERLTGLAGQGVLPVFWTERLPELGDPRWDEAPGIDVALSPQNITMPMLDSATVASARVRALTDGNEIAWLVTWPDPEANGNVDAGRFCDAVALQFPVGSQPPFTMGGRDQPVHILHWKSVWQRDVDEHFQDVQDLHPNYWADLYWFASGTFPFRIPDAFADTLSHAWLVGFRAGNPLSDIYREEPVEELSAIGFGTLTSQHDNASTGAARWENGAWTVLIRRPLDSADPQDHQFRPGMRSSFGVAVWDGGMGNVGARKHYSMWVPYEVQSWQS